MLYVAVKQAEILFHILEVLKSNLSVQRVAVIVKMWARRLKLYF
jgi:hypothetical protein